MAMEFPRKFNDCYFYYYSTCTKGDSCVFRHEPLALGCETMCAAWQQGKCTEKHCKLRHMELRKNRKQIPCYWENQPGGCRKKHCPFLHKNPDARTDGIAPSQPSMPLPNQAVSEVCEAVPLPAPQPTPVPLLWQQQRQVVLDSGILGVLPPNELVPRRVMPHDPTPYVAHPSHPAHGPLPVDPLVVNFEEESDNESAPSSTPTKTISPEESQYARTKSQELLLLEKIQAEAAAYYSYDDSTTTPEPPRKIVRTNLSTKYDRLSLDEISGKTQVTREGKRNSLDFKILSLDEIRARKKVNDAVVPNTPITLNLNSRKRKLSTHESITTGGKVIKVVRNNSVVYKKLDDSAKGSNRSCSIVRDNDSVNSKRTNSESSDVLDICDNELEDCYQFKKIDLTEQIAKPKLVRNKVNTDDGAKDTNNAKKTELNSVLNKNEPLNSNTKELNLYSDIDCKDLNNYMDSDSKDENDSDFYANDSNDINNKTEDSDGEVQIVDIVNYSINDLTKDHCFESEVIDVDASNNSNVDEVVDLSDDLEDSNTFTDVQYSTIKFPDVVTSCVTLNSKVDSIAINETIIDDESL